MAVLLPPTPALHAVVLGALVDADVVVTAPTLALRLPWPSMFRGYLHDEDRTRACFADGWYLTGDLVRRDEESWLWFAGRGDDVITSAGHRIGPVEVERVLLEHLAIMDAAVVGVPDRWPARP